MPLSLLRHTLPNGLTLLLRPMEGVGTVSTWVFYRVGGRHEPAGLTGISHWVEHMAFKGTPAFPKGEIARQVSRLGGFWDGMTWYDWTTYVETLPAGYLDLALRIEADRMANACFDPAEVEAERTVILSEREGNENDPAFFLHEEVTATALRAHPYRQPLFGWKEDLRRLSRDDLWQYYRAHYLPNNAVLVLAGAIEPDAALEEVARHLGNIPPGPPPPVVRAVEPPQQAERRLVLRRPAPAPIIEVAFPAPRAGDPDLIPFLVLDAVLSGAKGLGYGRRTSTHRSARLYRALVESELALAVSSSVDLTLDPGLFTVHAYLRAGRKPEEVEPRLLGELERLANEPPTPQELARTLRQLRALLAYGSESTTGQGYWLGVLAVVDRPERLDTILDEVAAVRPADVQRVAARYLGSEQRTVGWLVPAEVQAASPLPAMAAPPVPEVAVRPAPSRPEAGRGRPRSACGLLPTAAILRRPLPSGAVLLVHESHAHPLVAVQGYLRAGALFDPPGRDGLASMTAGMLNRGTAKRSFREIHEALEGVGSGVEFAAGPHFVTLAGKSLSADLPLLLELLVEMLRHPAFPAAEWERRRGEALTGLRHLEDDPDYVAGWLFRERLYPAGHPFRRRVEGTSETVAAMDREDLVAFHRRHYHPAGLVLAICGDVSPVAVEARLNDLLAGWEGPFPPDLPAVPRPPRLEGVQRAGRAMPGKSQSTLVWGGPGLARTDPDYYAALVANVILGQLGMMGRLGAAVRDMQGLAYGIRCRLEAGPAAGPWTVEAGVAPGNVERAVEAIVGEVGRFLEEEPTAAEMADAVTYLLGRLALSLETSDGVASGLLTLERYGLGTDFYERYPDILGRLTGEQVREVVGRYLSTTEYVLAVAGP